MTSKILQNNLTTQEAVLRKVKALRNTDGKVELAKEINSIINKLREKNSFINSHNNKEEGLKDISIVLLNSEHICPVYTKSSYCSLNPMYVNMENVILCTGSVGGTVQGDDIRGYRDIRNSTVEEIDVNTFNAFDYFNIVND